MLRNVLSIYNASMPIFLNHTEGSKAGQIESFAKEQIRIGRQADNDLKFDPKSDVSVSGYHAEIYRHGEKYFIKDLQSRNGTFVNARRIDAPVALKDGDTIQFSPRGPKAVFSTKDPSIPEGPPPVAEDARTQVFTPEEMKAPQTDSVRIWERVKPKLPIAAIATACIAIVGLGLYVGWPWWRLMINGAIALFAAAAGYFTWRMWKRRRALVEQEKSQEREAGIARGDQNNLQDLRRKWTEVVQSLKNSKLQGVGDDPIYALPWFLVIGESGCGKSALIKSGGALSSIVTSGADGPTRNCDWWFFNKVVVLDTSGRYVFQSKESEAQGEWQTLLGQLRTNRRSEPINGVIVTLAADALASRPIDKLKEQAAQIRERLDETTQQLGVKFPVYLVISKCDLIPGFNEFFDALPEQVRGQALGYANADPIINSDASRFFDRAFRAVLDRLGGLRLAVLGEAGRIEPARGAFLLPAELKALQGPIRASIEIIFRPSPYREPPFFRGLYFTSVRRGGAPISRLSRVLSSSYIPMPPGAVSHELFARDLFSAALPNDRSLVSQTTSSHERHRMTQSAGLVAMVAASLLLCGFLTMSFKNNWTALRESNFSPCVGAGKRAGLILGNLASADECHRVIDEYVPKTFWQKTTVNFGLAQWRRMEDKLQERFSIAFAATVLEPLNVNIDQRLSSGSASPLLLGAIFQRIQLLGACQEHSRCTFGESSKDVNYAVMLSTIDSQIREGHPSVSVFQRDYQSFLLWQRDEDAYQRMKSKDQERVDRWIRSGGLSNEGIVSAANELFTPIRAADFWDVTSKSQVEGAYTLNAWSKGIEPLVAALKQISTERTEKTKYEYDAREFEAKYKRATVQEWGEFLIRFAEAQPRALGNRSLALTLIGAESPYQAVLRRAHENLVGILGRAAGEQDFPAWVNLLKAYGELKEKLDKPQKNGKADDQPKDNEALGYLTAYFEALKQLPAKLSTPRDSFVAAQSAFREGEAAGKPSQAILQAYWAVKMLKSTGRFEYRDPTFWMFLERPVDVAWKSILDEAGTHLQQQWRQVYLAASGDDITPSLKAAKVIEFVNAQGIGFLKPQRSGYQVNTIQGQGVSFTPQFLALISTLSPSSLGGNAKLPERIVRN